MNRGSTDERHSAKYNTSSSIVVTATIEGEKQKQKKQLSFKEPEIETQHYFSHSPLPPPALKHSTVSRERSFHQIRTESLEDLTLEDQALQIAKNVGQAFVNPSTDLSIPDNKQTTPTKNKIVAQSTAEDVHTKESKIEDIRRKDNTSKLRTEDQLSQKILTPPTPAKMRCPIIEVATTEDDDEGNKTAGRGVEERNGDGVQEVQSLSSALKNVGLDPSWPTGARHQIQLLNLQLVQQRQHTQTAMSQIQLLKAQLEAESSARYQAQVQNQQLMDQNKELVHQIQQLFRQIQELEKEIEAHKKSNQPKVQIQEPKQETLPVPGTNQSNFRRNSASLWANTLNPVLGMIGRRNSATLSPTPQQEQSDSNHRASNDNFGRRVSIADDLLAAPQARFGGATDWRLRRRGSSNLSFDFAAKNKTSNSHEFSAIEDTLPSPEDRPKTTPLFSPEPRLGTSQSTKSKSEANPSLQSNLNKSDSLVINDSTPNDRGTESNLWSGRSFKPIVAAEEQRPPSYAKSKIDKERTVDSQSRLVKSLDTLRLFNS